MLKSAQTILTLSFLLLNVSIDITSVSAEPPTFTGYPIAITYHEFEKTFASEIKKCRKSNKIDSYIEVGSYLPKKSWQRFGESVKTDKILCSMKGKNM